MNIDGKRLNTDHPDFKKMEREVEEATADFDRQYDEILRQYTRPLSEPDSRALAHRVGPLHKEFSKRMAEIRAKYEHLYAPEAHI